MAIRSIFTRSLLIQRTRGQSINSYYFSETPAAAADHRSLIYVFQRYGFPPSELPNFLQKNRLLLNSSTPSDIETSLKILSALFKPSRDFLVSTVTSCPGVLQLDFLEKWQLGFAQLETQNVSSVAIRRNILEIARMYELCPDDLFRCMKSLKGLGFSEATIARVLETVPVVIASTEDRIRGKIEFLIRIGILRGGEIDRVIGLFPGILASGVENRLKPLLREFAELGFSLSEVRREVLRDPNVLGLENGEISQCLEMLRNLKCRVAIKHEIFRDGELRAGYRVKLRVDCLRKHGLIYRDAFRVLWKEPRVIVYEIEDIEKKIEYLVQTMKFDIECLVEVPEYLGVNFDKQIVPRFKVIEYLRASDGLGGEVGLRDLVKPSRLRFYNMYVKPYPECEKMYGRIAGNVEVRSRHPVGMWKIFRPQKYSNSSEDFMNIKSYIKTLH